MQAGLDIGTSMLSLKKPPGAVKRHHHAGPEVKDHRKFFLDVPPQVVAAAATRVYCKGALEAEGVLAMHGDQLLREVKGDLVSKFGGTRTALPQRSSHPTRLLSVPAVLPHACSPLPQWMATRSLHVNALKFTALCASKGP